MNRPDHSIPPPPLPQETSPPAALLAPGFRFHPTDEELVTYYLKRKVLSKPLKVDAIGEIDLYKCEPWDLPSRSRMRSRDLEWYFFSPLDRKHASNSRLRTNRATKQGYWKTTGKDREVKHGGKVVGMKKTLVFHAGRAPRGQRTNWVMHEYRLESDGVSEDSYVVCRIFQKNGLGPQNGAQYGAPFVEEEWGQEETNGLVFMGDFGADSESNNINGAGENEFLQMEDFLQNEEFGDQLEASPLPTTGDLLETSLEEILNDPSFTGGGEKSQNASTVDQSNDANSPAKTEGYLELNDLADLSNLTFFPNDGSAPVTTGGVETVNFDEFFDFKNDDFAPGNEIIYSPAASPTAGLDFIDELATYYDATDDNLFYDSFAPNNKVGGVSSVTYGSSSNNNLLNMKNGDLTVFSDVKKNSYNDNKSVIGKGISNFLGSISAPPAFAEEFPPAARSAKLDGPHLSADTVHIGEWSVQTNANVELLLSYSVSEKSLGFESNPKMNSGTIVSVLRGGFCLFFLSALMLLVSYKIGVCVCDR